MHNDDDAAATVAAAQAAAGVRVEILHRDRDQRAAAEVLQRIWHFAGGAPLAPETLHALVFTGNYVAGAFDGEEMVAVASGFRSADGTLHSHIAGVLPTHRGRSVGYVLKLHQRAWALEAGIDRILWTFDPMIRRNAHFNLVKLGARPIRFLPDFYGPMSDAVNIGDRSDRMLAEWDLTSPVPAGPQIADPSATAVVTQAPDGGPRSHPAAGPHRTIALPPDFELLRSTDRPLAARWRQAVRAALADATAEGLAIAGLDAAGNYVIGRRDDAT